MDDKQKDAWIVGLTVVVALSVFRVTVHFDRVDARLRALEERAPACRCVR